MNKVHKCLYIASLFRDKGSVSRQDIEDSIMNRFPGEPPLSESTLQRYLRFIEETMSCIIEYNRTTHQYSMRYPEQTPPSFRETVEHTLDIMKEKEEIKKDTFVFDPKTMMFLAVRMVNGEYVHSPFLADTMEEALQKSLAFYGDTLQTIWVSKRGDMDKIPVSDIRPIWMRGLPGISTNLQIDFKRIGEDFLKKHQQLKDGMDDGTFDLKPAFDETINDEECKYIAKICKDKEKYDLMYRVFQLGILAKYPFKDDPYMIMLQFNASTDEFSNMLFDMMDRYDSLNEDLMLLFMTEKDSVLKLFMLGMVLATTIEIIE